MDDWKQESIDSFCNSVRDGTHDSPKPCDTGRYLITSRHIIGGNVDLNKAYLISQEDFDEVNKRSKVDQWDVLITMIGTVGEVCLVKTTPDFAIKNVGLFKSKGELHGKWLYYYLISPEAQTQIEASKRGTTQSYLPLEELRRFEIKVPTDRSRMPSIVDILSSLDDKIELNRRTNETLEALAQALFKDWFVDFGPTRAKAEGQAPYLAPELWELFPDALNEKDKPERWKVKTLGDYISLTKGRSYKSAELQESDTALVTLKSFQRGGGYRRDGLKPFTGNYKPEQVIKPGELIVALTDVTQAADVIGKPAIVSVDSSYKTLVASLDVGILRAQNKKVSLPYLYCLLRTEEFQNHIYGHCSGTTVLHLGKQGIPSYELRMPPASLLAFFEDLASPVFSQIAANEEESRTLEQTRDLLLPKLMSGEIHLCDAEKAVEAVL